MHNNELCPTDSPGSLFPKTNAVSFSHREVVDLQSGLQQQEEADDLQRRQPLDGKSDQEEKKRAEKWVLIIPNGFFIGGLVARFQ